MSSSAGLSLLVLIGVLQAVSSSRFKIALPSEGEAENDDSHYLAKRDEMPCEEYKEISNPESLIYPEGFQHLRRPWIDNPSLKAKTGKSQSVSRGISSLFQKVVPGLEPKITINGVLDVLKKNECLSFPFGGSVRDQLLGASPKDLDMESNCNGSELYDICVKKWGNSPVCSYTKQTGIMHIGDNDVENKETEAIDASGWNDTFFGDGTHLEYTTNSIAYFAEGLNITIDITGQGVSDTCMMLIRIPVDDDNRYHWSLDKTLMAPPDKIDFIKVFRFWKLRKKGYKPADESTKEYIVNIVEDCITSGSCEADFKKFYCTTVLGGKYTSSSGKCEIQSKQCQGALDDKKKYDAVFEADLEIWSQRVKKLIEGLESTCCSATVLSQTSFVGVAIWVMWNILLY